MTSWLKVVFGLGVVALVVVWLLLLGWREPAYQGKHLSRWIREMNVVALKVVELQDTTYVFLGNLSDEELLPLQVKAGNPKIRYLGGNDSVEYSFFPHEGIHGADAADILHAGPHRWADTSPSAIAVTKLGPRAIPWLIAGLHRRDSKLADSYARIWPQLPFRFRYAIGPAVHPAHIRMNSAFALGLLGPSAKAAAPELKKRLQDPSPWVRAAAAEALQRIDPATAGEYHAEIFRPPPGAVEPSVALAPETAPKTGKRQPRPQQLSGENKEYALELNPRESGVVRAVFIQIPDGAKQAQMKPAPPNPPVSTGGVFVLDPGWKLNGAESLDLRQR